MSTTERVLGIKIEVKGQGPAAQAISSVGTAVDRVSESNVNLGKTSHVGVDGINEVGSSLKKTTPVVENHNAKLNMAAMTTRQYANSMRMVPAQLTDIVIGLQAGQAPMTVLLQQGGQLKDMFGGIGPAARAMATYVMSLVNPFTVTAAAVVGLGAAYYAGWKEQEQMRNSLIVTGYAAGMSAQQIAGHAQEVGRLTGNYGDAKDAAQVLAATGMFTGETLVTAMSGVTASVKLTGAAVGDAAKEYAMLAADPVRNILRLNEQYHFLTAAVYQHIKALDDQGDRQGAIKLAVETLAQTHRERMDEMRGQVGWLESGWNAFTEAISGAKNALLEIGKDPSLQDLQKRYDDILAKVDRARNVRTVSNIGNLPALERDLAAAKAELDQAQERVRQAEEKAKTGQENDAQLKQSQAYDSYTSSQARMTISQALSKQLAEESKAFDDATKGLARNSDEYRKAEALHQTAVKHLRDRADAQQRQADGSNRVAQAYESLVNKSKDLVTSMQYEQTEGEKLTQGQKTVQEIREMLAKSTGKLTSNQRALLETYAAQITAIEASTQAEEAKAERMRLFAEEQKAHLLAQREYEAALQAVNDSVDQLTGAAAKEAATMQEQIDKLKLGAAAVNRLEQSRLMDAAAAYDQAAAMMKINEESPAAIKFVEQQAAAIRKLAAARNQLASNSAELQGIKDAKKAHEEMMREAERAHENLNRSLTDALLRGFESGKGFAENFRDTLKNMFNTLILRPIIQAVVSPVTDVLSQIFGGAGASATGTGTGSSASTWLGAAKSIYDIKSGSSMSQGLMGTVGGWLGNISTMIGSQSLGQFASGVAGKMVGTAAGLGPTAAGSATGIGAMSSGWGAAGAMAAKAMPWVGAALQAFSGDIKGAAWTAAGAAIGSVVPVIGTALGAVIGNLVGSLFGGKSPKKYGNSATTTYADGGIVDTSTGILRRNLGVGSGLSGLNEAFSSSLGGLLSGFNLDDSIKTSSNMIARTNVRGGFNAEFDGGSVNFGGKFGKTKNTDIGQAFDKLVDIVMGKVLVDAIQKSKLPEGIRALFDGMTDRTKVGEMINATLALNNVQEQLADRFGLTVDAAAKVSTQTGYTGDELTAFVNQLAATAGAFKTTGQTLIEARDNYTAYVEAMSGSAILPTTLDAFDALLKTIDTTTQEGIEKFTALFGIRDGFTSYINTMDTLKANVDTSIYGMLSPSEQLAKNQQTLAAQFADLNLTMPDSIDELINLGAGIDYTTEAGLNLAAAFPGLVSGFMTIQEQTEQLATTLNAFDTDKFSSLFDYQMYRGVASNSSIDKANSLLGVPGFATGGTHSGGWRIVGENGPELEYTGPSRIFSNSESARMLSGSDNNTRQLEAELRDVKNILVQILKYGVRTSDTLEEWSDLGMPEQRELSA